MDAAFLPMIEVIATSIAASASSGRAVDYHVLYEGPDSWMTRRLHGWRRGVVSVHLHRAPARWQRFGTVSGFPPASLGRLSLHDVLTDLPRVIYLDADLVVETDLAELFDTPLAGHPLAAVRDRHVAEQSLRPDGGKARFGLTMRQYLESVAGLHGDAEIADYRQSGVLVMDLEALRAMDFASLAESVVAERGDRLQFADQCVINIVLKANMAELDPRWNVLASDYSPEAVAAAVPAFRAYAALQAKEQRIRHFAGPKPWLRLGMAGGDRWWRHARATGLGPYFALRHLRERTRLELANLARKLHRLANRAR